MTKSPMTLGGKIAALRLNARESLQDVADAVGVSKAHIWELEKGRADNPSLGLVTRLADHFKVSIASLVGEDAKAKDADADIQRMFRQVSKLDAHERGLLNDMMESLISRRRKTK
ncbi:MAG TPA: helix-turn-helix transcriptional regulator [Rhizomicrobium sp.]|nr:helix-turn-helix transcriptional regulator [Rhizomicrobium sp.]